MPSMRVLTARQMREADRRTIEEIGIPSLVLMENAGREVASAIEQAFPDLVGRRVAILCGRGNNGGDGFVVARLLHQRGVDVSVFLVGRASDVKGDARVEPRGVPALGLPVVEIGRRARLGAPRAGIRAPHADRRRAVRHGPVDAADGPPRRRSSTTSTRRRAGRVDRSAQRIVRRHPRRDRPVHPGHAHRHARGAEAAARPVAGQRAWPGDLVVADIGIPPSVIESLDGADLRVITPEALRPLVRPRAARRAQGRLRPRAASWPGSRGKTGAAHLAACGALRSGAGLVTVATPASCQPMVAAHGPRVHDRGGCRKPAWGRWPRRHSRRSWRFRRRDRRRARPRHR